LNLLQIPLHFNYEVYTTTRRERDLDAYLNALSDIVQRHTTADVSHLFFFLIKNEDLFLFVFIRFSMLFRNVSNVFAMLVLHYQIERLLIEEILSIRSWLISMQLWAFSKKWFDEKDFIKINSTIL